MRNNHPPPSRRGLAAGGSSALTKRLVAPFTTAGRCRPPTGSRVVFIALGAAGQAVTALPPARPPHHSGDPGSFQLSLCGRQQRSRERHGQSEGAGPLCLWGPLATAHHAYIKIRRKPWAQRRRFFPSFLCLGGGGGVAVRLTEAQTFAGQAFLADASQAGPLGRGSKRQRLPRGGGGEEASSFCAAGMTPRVASPSGYYYAGLL